MLLLENTGGRRLRGVVRDAWQPTAGASGNRHRIGLSPGDRVLLRTALRPRRRGDLRAVGVTARLRGPLGLAARQRTLDVPGTVRSLPPFESRKHLPSRLARLRDLDGRAAIRVRGQGTEFDSLREYVRGDDVRSIDWRASARNRTWSSAPGSPSGTAAWSWSSTPPGPRPAGSRTCPGSTRRWTPPSSWPRSPRAPATASTSWPATAGCARGCAQRGARDVAANLQDTMADLEPVIAEADWAALAGAVTEFGRQRALVVLLTPLEPSAVEEGLLPVLPTLTRHHRVVLASVRDPALERLAAPAGPSTRSTTPPRPSRRWSGAATPPTCCGPLGVDVIDADAERLPPALADHYLSLKARGLL